MAYRYSFEDVQLCVTDHADVDSDAEYRRAKRQIRECRRDEKHSFDDIVCCWIDELTKF